MKEGKINFISLLKQKGYKVTPTRILVLETFSKNEKPLSVDIIYKKLQGRINEVTIYRIISSFLLTGILKRVDLRKDRAYFELNNDHHHHIVCTKCDVVESFTDCDIDKLMSKFLNKSSKFVKINAHSFELFGVCKSCKLKN